MLYFFHQIIMISLGVLLRKVVQNNLHKFASLRANCSNLAYKPEENVAHRLIWIDCEVRFLEFSIFLLWKMNLKFFHFFHTLTRGPNLAPCSPRGPIWDPFYPNFQYFWVKIWKFSSKMSVFHSFWLFFFIFHFFLRFSLLLVIFYVFSQPLVFPRNLRGAFPLKPSLCQGFSPQTLPMGMVSLAERFKWLEIHQMVPNLSVHFRGV